MNEAERKAVLARLSLMKDDILEDVNQLDRAPFDARTVGSTFGKMYGLIHVLIETLEIAFAEDKS